MLVIFRRTGQRRYAIEARRPRFGAVEMNPAPGYDELMPHDLLHLVVEAQLGLKHGIFGQLAAGGNAGTFRSYVGPSKAHGTLLVATVIWTFAAKSSCEQVAMNRNSPSARLSSAGTPG